MAKRILSIFLALVLAGFSGCGQQESPGPVATAAKGRYVETEIALPMDGSPQDMVTLSDGRLRVGLNTTEGGPTSSPGRETPGRRMSNSPRACRTWENWICSGSPRMALYFSAW